MQITQAEKKCIKILLVEDNQYDAQIMKVTLDQSHNFYDFELFHSVSLSGAFLLLETHQINVIVLDLLLPDSAGIDTLTQMIEKAEDIPIIVLTGNDNEELGIKSVHLGAQDYLIKGEFGPKSLIRAICYANERQSLLLELKKSRQREIDLCESKFECIYENSPVMIFTIDQNGVIMDVNRKWCIETGYDKRFVIGKRIDNFVTDDMKQYVMDTYFRDLKRNSCLKDAMLQYKLNDGKVIDVLWSAVFFDTPDGKTIGFCVIQDVTERNRIQKELQIAHDALEVRVFERTAALEKANAELQVEINERKKVEEELKKAKINAETANYAKSEFLANVSHEIRTPLNGILGFIDLLMNTELKEEQLDYVQTIKNSGYTLLKLINEILDFSKIESGQIELENTEFDPGLVAYDVCELISFIIINKPVEILCNVDYAVPSYVRGDFLRFKQVLINLMSNASKFTEKGEIELAIKVIEETGERVKLYVCVSDTGIGISTDKINFIFEAFKQADGSVTRKYGGTGLGLAICKKIINLMGGDIFVESSPNLGSKFHFTAWFDKSKKVSEIDSPSQVLKNKKILIIDDSLANLQVISKILSLEGSIVETLSEAVNVFDVIKKSFDNKALFDVIILDIQMPDTDGFEIAKKIRNSLEVSIRNIPLLAFSTIADKDIKKFIESGFNGFLPKPINRHKTVEIVSRIIEKNASFSDETDNELSAVNEKINYSIKILLAEDHPVNQKLALILMTSGGCRVDVANNGKETVELYLNSLCGEPYDLIFMDVQMPLMDGLTASKKIREIENENFNKYCQNIFIHNVIDFENVNDVKNVNDKIKEIKKKHIPIVAMTASAVKGDREKCLAAGMDDYISKPVSKEMIFDIINKWVVKNNM